MKEKPGGENKSGLCPKKVKDKISLKFIDSQLDAFLRELLANFGGTIQTILYL
ncbi:hypothetical protein PRO82_000006 [Candidatus Protochlamydia amoebophila]|nr:hypothetical protein [Candidatus Protochlamydia amoebophila]